MSRINIIYHGDGRYYAKWDMKLFHGALTAYLPTARVRRMDVLQSPPEDADLNVFLEVPNALHYTYARDNVLLLRRSAWSPSWVPLLTGLTGIVVTNDADHEFATELVGSGGAWVRRVEWVSHDITPGKPRFHKHLVQANDVAFTLRLAGFLVANWRDGWPELTVVYDPAAGKLTTAAGNVRLVPMYGVSEAELDELRRDHGYHWCPPDSDVEDQAQSVAAITLFPDDGGRLTVAALEQALADVDAAGWKDRKAAGDGNRRLYEQRYGKMKTDLAELLAGWKDVVPFVRPATVPILPDDLPHVTIITPTRDRPNWMKLAKYCFLMQNYPRDKLHWRIRDEGTQMPSKAVVGEVENTVYTLDDPVATVSDARNALVAASTTDLIVHCDDDDYYPPNSVLSRVREFMAARERNPAVGCVYSTTIACYHALKFGSAMNIPPAHLPPHMRVSEATMIYTKAFWEERPWVGAESEGAEFLVGRLDRAVEVSSEPVIVALQHAGNSGRRKFPTAAEGNGCHFGWTDELFQFVTDCAETTVVFS